MKQSSRLSILRNNEKYIYYFFKPPVNSVKFQ